MTITDKQYKKMRRSMNRKHKHEYTTHGCNFYHIGGTRLWLFRKCSKCNTFQNAIVDTTSYIKWRPYKIGE